ncbi:hypothetical protein [Priestia endophytica]|uniref:hypothetical protein n=1 Tax=Priestia endophytica TaxID=135735 RepID=UPI00228170F6|nr:hypothetical protein [Priestia endophytica]MCY8233161.1 hypothetical protein [Priestia endophytica]
MRNYLRIFFKQRTAFHHYKTKLSIPVMTLLLFNGGLSSLFLRDFDYTSLGEAFLFVFGLGLVVGLIYTFVGSFFHKTARWSKCNV